MQMDNRKYLEYLYNQLFIYKYVHSSIVCEKLHLNIIALYENDATWPVAAAAYFAEN